MAKARYTVVTDDLEVAAKELRKYSRQFSKEEIAAMYAKEVRGAFLNNIISRTPGVRVLHISGTLRKGLRVFVRGGVVVITMVYYGLFVDRGTRSIRARNFTDRAREIGFARLVRRLDGRD